MDDKIKRLMKVAEKETDHVIMNHSQGESVSTSIKNSSITDTVSESKDSFIVKVWIKGREGFSYSNRPSIDTVKRAINVARNNLRKDDFFGIPSSPKKIPNTDNYDEMTDNMGYAETIEQAKRLIRRTSSNYNETEPDNTKLSLLEGDIERSTSKRTVMSSEGVDHSYTTTDYAVYGRTLGKNSSTYDNVRHESEFFDIEPFADDLVQKSRLFTDEKRLTKEDRQTPCIILNRECFSQLLKESFLDGLNGENIINKNSLFIDKLNEKICDNITIHDNALYTKGVSSRPLDFEGTPSKDTMLVEKGRLKNYITDYNTAKKLGIESTGNSFQKGIDHTNVVVEGKHRNIDKSIVIDSILGAHTSNSLTTDFSVSVERAYVLDGEEKRPLKNFMISGNMLKLLGDVVSVGTDKKNKNGVYSGGIALRGLSIN